jgi:NADH:ubiquinone reductase (H+-translocating)
LGVEVRTATRVKAISQGRLDLENGETIFAENIIWAAGVSASPLTQKLGVELDRAGRVKVNPDLSVPGHSEVFAIGDMALVVGEGGRPTPGVSPAAMQMAKHVARTIEHELVPGGDFRRPPFRYRDHGSMATIGRSAAVAKVGRCEFSGFPAWLMWLGVHLIFLIGFRNKAAVLLQWAYSYFTYKRGARIITGLSDETKRCQAFFTDVQSSTPPRDNTPSLVGLALIGCLTLLMITWWAGRSQLQPVRQSLLKRSTPAEESRT